MTIPAGHAQVTMHFNFIGGTGKDMLCVFGVENSTGKTPLLIAQDVRTDFASGMDDIMSGQYQLTKTFVERADGLIAEDPTVVPGTVAGSGETPQVSWLFKKASGLSGRHNRGRLYLPGVPEQWTSASGLIDTAQVANASAFANGFLGQLLADDIPMVILHTDGALAPTPVSALDASSRVATQRRRNRAS